MTEVIKPKMMAYKRQVLVCIGSRCTQNGEGQALYDELKDKLKAAGVDKGDLRVKRSRVTCFGTCRSGPLMCVQPDGIWYYDLNSTKLDRIIEEHFRHNRPVEDYIYHRQE